MYAIENDLGRFEAATEREAKKLLRQAIRAAQKQQAIDDENRNLARLKAQASAFRLLSALVEKRVVYSHPWIIRPTDSFWPCAYADGTYRFRADDSGSCVMEFYGYRPIAASFGVDGTLLAIWTQDESSGEICGMAVGVQADQWSYEYLPAEITPEWCERTES